MEMWNGVFFLMVFLSVVFKRIVIDDDIVGSFDNILFLYM